MLANCGSDRSIAASSWSYEDNYPEAYQVEGRESAEKSTGEARTSIPEAATKGLFYRSYVNGSHYDHLRSGVQTGEARSIGRMTSGMRDLRAGDYLSLRHGQFRRYRTAITLRTSRARSFSNLKELHESQSESLVYAPGLVSYTCAASFAV